MGEAVDRLVALAGRIQVEGHTRTSKRGNVVRVGAYTRSPRSMKALDLIEELNSLTKTHDAKSRVRRVQLAGEIRRRRKAGQWKSVDTKRLSQPNDQTVASLSAAAVAGGFTYDRLAQEPVNHGVAVGRPGGSSIRPASTREDAQKQLVGFLNDLPADVDTVGGWLDTENNEICLDVVDIVPDVRQAVQLGRKRNQQAIFDLDHLKEIPTGGTGDERT